MALIKCPNCQKDVSDKALQCPKCGFAITNYLSAHNDIIPKNTSSHANTAKHRKMLKVILLMVCISLTLYFGVTTIKKYKAHIEMENQLRIERETYLPIAEAVNKICETFTVSINSVNAVYAKPDGITYFVQAENIGYVVSDKLPQYTSTEREQIIQILGKANILPVIQQDNNVLMKYDIVEIVDNTLSSFAQSIQRDTFEIVQEGLDAVFEIECLMAEEVDIELVKKYYKDLNS